MHENEFRAFLKRGGRAPRAIERCLRMVREFESYLQEHAEDKDIDAADPEDLQAFVAWIEREPKTPAKTYLWALRYYFEYVSDEAMCNLAGALREARIKRTPFALAQFRNVDADHVDRLADVGIRNVKQMLKAGRTLDDRASLAAQTGIPPDAILEFVKLSDLARIPGIKGIRARLYHDAGVDTVEKLAEWDPAELKTKLSEWVAQTGFDGIAPLPKEVTFSVATARRLPKIVEYKEKEKNG